VATLGVVLVVVSRGSGLRGYIIWLHQTDTGKKESKANMSTHPKYSASKDLDYICNNIKGRLYMCTELQNCQNRGESLVLLKTSIFSIFSGLAALEECKLA